MAHLLRLSIVVGRDVHPRPDVHHLHLRYYIEEVEEVACKVQSL
jgi:hypothetical protein